MVVCEPDGARVVVDTAGDLHVWAISVHDTRLDQLHIGHHIASPTDPTASWQKKLRDQDDVELYGRHGR
jgi:hypothetical protein